MQIDNQTSHACDPNIKPAQSALTIILMYLSSAEQVAGERQHWQTATVQNLIRLLLYMDVRMPARNILMYVSGTNDDDVDDDGDVDLDDVCWRRFGVL